ncbi:Rieske 2Fe-2S domain-containing protein [Candidatus Magnetaquicoccus inordinatus]|uniref:Rieske 2Fe-2S domain-containing protein n=1 Tax=Candidatus Magnetaquicoccus inordinatus TaxID=2496818 RepID=UPI00102B3320|nr:Rieske 2Fe-2S domain-containing protein [Candidatus Magnetaquicoccus inordinatus]
MSKALTYLAKARPEAATSLLSFYKHSVQALDEKTRHLIQIVTKVTVGTERGLRQYAPKALKAGASREEILDAVLMAFPAAGLNKVLDAIDIMREMDLLPEVAQESPTADSSLRLCTVADLPLQRLQTLQRPSGDLLLYRTDNDTVLVYSARCPHSKANLCHGTDHGTQVECRVHNWTFDLASGACLQPANGKTLQVVATEIRDGQLYLLSAPT